MAEQKAKADTYKEPVDPRFPGFTYIEYAEREFIYRRYTSTSTPMFGDPFRTVVRVDEAGNLFSTEPPKRAEPELKMSQEAAVMLSERPTPEMAKNVLSSKKPIIEEWCAAYARDDLSPAQAEQLEKWFNQSTGVFGGSLLIEAVQADKALKAIIESWPESKVDRILYLRHALNPYEGIPTP